MRKYIKATEKPQRAVAAGRIDYGDATDVPDLRIAELLHFSGTGAPRGGKCGDGFSNHVL